MIENYIIFVAALALVFGVAALAGIVSDILCVMHNVRDNWPGDTTREDNTHDML